MYLSHYNLHQMPFQISPDPRFLWLGEKHKEALAVLKYGVMNNQGFLLLTGDVGTGKTTLINALVNSLGPDTFFINVADPRMDKLDFFKLVVNSFGLDAQVTTKLDFLISFKQFLHRAYDTKKKVLLIIDEAQKLSLDSLEEVRLLSNIERQDTKLLNVFFIGQNEFNDTLVRPECRALRQRITIVHNIEPLNEKEAAEYVKYRLRVAGAQREIFTDKALKGIYAFSKGYPRLINTMCDRALLTGYSRDLRTIDRDVIRECTKELSLPGEMRSRPPSEADQYTWLKRRRARRAAVLAALVVLVALSGYVFASRFLGDQTFSVRRYYTALFGSADRNTPQKVSGQIEAPATDPSSHPTHSRGASEAPQTPASVSQAKKALTAGNAGDLKTGEQGSLFRESRLVIPFGFNLNELSPETLARLDELADYMLRQPDAEIVIRGYTDALGSPDYNKSLSTFRANVVRSYLVGKGIDPNRMKVIGMGHEAPRMTNATAEGRSANRRVEIEFVAPRPQGGAASPDAS
jgi:general secretion pathway protein A